MDVVRSLVHHPEFGLGHADHPTAQQVIDREGLAGKLADKVVLITGASSGLGVETARVLYQTGAHLFLAVRDVAKTEQVKADIEAAHTGGVGKIDILTVDMASLDSVRKCAADFLSKSKRLNILVCNAGVMAAPEGKTKDGFETHFGTNHIAHFLLFQLLKDALLSSSTPSFNSRVVVLSSSGHEYSPVVLDDLDFAKRGYSPFAAYGQSKTANAYMALELDRRYGSRSLHSTALNPGAVVTELARHVDPAVAEQMVKQGGLIRQFKPLEKGAATTVWAAVSRDWEGKGGKYLDDCGVSRPKAESPSNSGFVEHLYDAQAAKQLWVESLRMVGLQDDQSA